LNPADWKAQWIAAPKQNVNEDGSLQPIRLRKHFNLPQDQEVRRARLYITSLGCYDAYLDGSPVGSEVLSPGWQSYKHRLHYQTYDVTALLSGSDDHELDITVAAGWYASALAWAGGRRCFFGDTLALFVQLVIDFDSDHETKIVCSNGSWQSISSPVVSSEIYKGEVYDQSLRSADWGSGTVEHARIIDRPSTKLISPESAPIQVIESIAPTRIFRSPSGKVLIDFGQNLVGRLSIKSLTKPAGSKIQLAHAEVLENGELGRRPLRHATSTDVFICDGLEAKNWTPKFTFHGFRYVEVLAWTPEDNDNPLTLESIEAQVLHTNMKRIGHFECSHTLVNKLHENALWSMKGNFLSLPTDCPQRDERLGWTGDIQVFAPAGNFLYDTTGMLSNWLEDLAAEQLSPEHNGVPPFVVPDVISQTHPGDTDFWIKTPNAVWDDAAVLIPWNLYKASGDASRLEKQFESMSTWLDKGIKRGSDGLWDPELYQLGDWLDPIAPPSEPGNGRTDGTLVADAYLVHITKRMAKICNVLERASLTTKYSSDYDKLLEQFQYKYITKAGYVVGDSQTAMALAIVFELLESPEQLRNIAARLARSVRMQQFRVSTGFAGTPIVLHALTKGGYSQYAYRMLLERRCPSWLYAVGMGATTIWERWDSMLLDGSINPGEMTSFNHYALGSVVNWLHESVGGISPLSPGWKEILVRPVPGGNITRAKVSHESPYGLIECSWRIEDGGHRFVMNVTVPPNSRAKVVLPADTQSENSEAEGDWVGSGTHHFECKLEMPPWPPEAMMPPFWPQPAAMLAE
jgi:alpha-L-rhamnosidase